MEMQILTVHHYDENLEEERRITLSTQNITVVAAHVNDITIRGRSLRRVTVLLADSANVDLVLNHADLELLEKAVGAFWLNE